MTPFPNFCYNKSCCFADLRRPQKMEGKDTGHLHQEQILRSKTLPAQSRRTPHVGDWQPFSLIPQSCHHWVQASWVGEQGSLWRVFFLSPFFFGGRWCRFNSGNSALPVH